MSKDRFSKTSGWQFHKWLFGNEKFAGLSKTAMEIVGLQWNPRKCNFLHARRGETSDGFTDGFTDGQTTINCLKKDGQYRFRGTLERLLQEEKLALDIAARAYP